MPGVSALFIASIRQSGIAPARVRLSVRVGVHESSALAWDFRERTDGMGCFSLLFVAPRLCMGFPRVQFLCSVHSQTNFVNHVVNLLTN